MVQAAEGTEGRSTKKNEEKEGAREAQQRTMVDDTLLLISSRFFLRLPSVVGDPCPFRLDEGLSGREIRRTGLMLDDDLEIMSTLDIEKRIQDGCHR